MKKKELLKNISNFIEGQEFIESPVESFTSKLCLLLAKVGIVSSIIYAIFFIYALVNIEQAGELSNISISGYLILTGILLIISLVLGIFCLSLYIYNKDKKIRFSMKHLKIFNTFYQNFDIVNFVGIFLTVFLWIIVFIVTPVEINTIIHKKTVKKIPTKFTISKF